MSHALIEEQSSMEQLTAVFERDGDWWVGYVEELPGANTQGSTLEEARENLREAVKLVIEANRELARQDAEGKDVLREPLVLSGE
jgi:predicted RNase H-like HicB family nuclease